MGDEQCLRFGVDNPAPGCATILFIPPLFDESNRLRRTLVLTMRALAARGHVALLPDLPGQNDSILPNASATMAQWRDAIAALCAQLPAPFIIASWRGGALLDDAATGAAGWWRMAPQGGASLVKMMMRTRIAGDKESGRTTTAQMLRE
ncbi:MAG: alpha/beta fold hydrolase, partial [Sphingopyxis sp.]